MPRIPTEEAVRRKLSQYLGAKISLRQLNAWLMESTQAFDRSSDKGLHQLVYAVKLRLAEHTSCHWTEAALRTKLAALISIARIDSPESALK